MDHRSKRRLMNQVCCTGSFFGSLWCLAATTECAWPRVRSSAWHEDHCLWHQYLEGPCLGVFRPNDL